MDVLSVSVPLALLTVIAYLAVRRPVTLALLYLAVAPFDAYQFAVGGLLLSLADLCIVGLGAACFLLRPRTALVAPRWYTFSVALLVIAVVVSVAGNYPMVSIAPARALMAKVVGGFCAGCILIRSGTPLRIATRAFCIGVVASVALGLLQQAVYIWSGWEALLAWLPRVVNPGGVGGFWADAVDRGELGFAVVSPSRGFTPFAMRMPGGTPHTALLGLLVTFPLGLGAGYLFCRRRPLWGGIALVATGLLGFFVTEGRAAILGVFVSVAWLFARSLFLRRSLGMAALLMVALSAQAVIITAMLDQDMGLRRDAILDAVSDMTRFAIGMGPGEYESQSVVGINVHSTPLQLFTDVGVVGLIAYAVLVVGTVSVLWRHARDQDVLVLGAAISGYLICAMFLHPSAGTREHWIVLTLAALAGQLGAYSAAAATAPAAAWPLGHVRELPLRGAHVGAAARAYRE